MTDGEHSEPRDTEASKHRIPPERWSIEYPMDVSDWGDRELPRYEDDPDPPDGAAPRP